MQICLFILVKEVPGDFDGFFSVRTWNKFYEKESNIMNKIHRSN